MRWIVAVVVLSLAACDNTTRGGGEGGNDDGGGTGGSGDGGTGGGSTGGSGGTGGSEPPDVQAPSVSIAEPAEGDAFEEPFVTLRGTATDDTGIARLWLTLGEKDRWDLPADGSTEVPFEVEVRLAEGNNAISVFAEDAAGNRFEFPLTLHLVNPEGKPVVIESFEPARTWVENGTLVELRWKVSGTRPIELWIVPENAYAIDVSDANHEDVLVNGMNTALFHLLARNELGETYRSVQVGVGNKLKIWPSGATLLSGARQALSVDNAAYNVGVDWTSSGGEIGTSLYSATTFRAETPGVYTITATTRDSEPRTDSVQITVAEIPLSSVRGFRGMGGQFADVNGRSGRGLAVDEHGNPWVQVGSGGLASWHPDLGGWSFEGDANWGELRHLYRLSNGDLVATGTTTLARLESGATAWATDPAGLPEEVNSSRQGFGPDGTFYVMELNWSQPSRLLVLAPGAAGFEELPLPEGTKPIALAFDDAGTMFLAGKDEANLTSVFRRADAGEWVDTGPVPNPAEGINDLIVAGDGRLHLAGRTLARLDGEAWEIIGSFPTCPEDQLCGLFDLEVRSDGTLLVVEREELYAQGPDGSFAVVGITVPEMHVENLILGALRRVAEAPDGTLYLLGDLGVYSLPIGAETWTVLGEPGMMPSAEANDLLVEPDGSWTLASGGWGGQKGHFSVYERGPNAGPWTGFHPNSSDSVVRIARDSAGNLYGWHYFGRVFVIDGKTGETEFLPFDSRLSRMSDHALGVTQDGTVYASGQLPGTSQASSVTLRHRPGADQWTVVSSFYSPDDYVRASDGVLWALDGAPARLVGGSWENVLTGLPSSLRGADLAVAEDGTLLLADKGGGVYRLDPEALAWRRVGTGAPSTGASRVASRGGRTWALAGNQIFELDAATQCWVPLDTWVSADPSLVFDAAPDGSLLISSESVGLLQSVDGT